MTVLTHASREELQTIVQEFATLSWPVPAANMPQIADRLGWVALIEGANSVTYSMPLAMANADATASLSGGTVNEVQIDVSERIDRKDPLQQAVLGSTFDVVRSELVDFLGDPVHVRKGKFPRVTWDLSNGGRVAVERLGSVVQFVVLQERYADIERFEESRGISDDRDPQSEESNLM